MTRFFSAVFVIGLIAFSLTVQAAITWGETITAGSTEIKADHINELRAEISNLESQVGGAGQWADGTASSINYGLGNVGIGDTNPLSKLDLGANYSNPGVTPNKISLWNGGDNNYMGFGVSSSDLDYFSQSNHRFYTGYNGSAGTEKFTILGNGNVGIGTTAPAAKLDVAGGLNLTDRTYTNNGTTRTFENVASYYAGSTPNTGTIVVEIGSTPNIMLDAEIVIQGYNGLTKCNVRGYTYTGSTSWHLPQATCLGSTTGTGDYTVRFGKNASTNARVIMIGTTSSAWGNYPHVSVPRVTYGYPGGSSSSIGDWSISIVTSEAAYTSIVNVNENQGFEAYSPIFGGNPRVTGTLRADAIGHDDNGAGNIHIDAGNTGGTDHIYLNYYSGDGVYFGNGATGLVGAWKASGNVGIGTSAPTQKLHVIGNSLLAGTVYLGATDTALFRDAANRIATDDNFYVRAASPNTYLYSTNTYLGGGSGDTTRLRGNNFVWNQGIIEGNGEVGIGTTSPSEKLDVVGNVKATAFLYSSDKRLKENV